MLSGNAPSQRDQGPTFRFLKLKGLSYQVIEILNDETLDTARFERARRRYKVPDRRAHLDT